MLLFHAPLISTHFWPASTLLQLSRGVLKRKKFKDSIHYNADPNSAEVLMKTVVSANRLSMSRAVLTWYLENRSEGEIVSQNAFLNILQELVTKLTRHETSDMFV